MQPCDTIERFKDGKWTVLEVKLPKATFDVGLFKKDNYAISIFGGVLP